MSAGNDAGEATNKESVCDDSRTDFAIEEQFDKDSALVQKDYSLGDSGIIADLQIRKILPQQVVDLTWD